MEITKGEKIKIVNNYLDSYRQLKKHTVVLEKKINMAKNTLRCQNSISTTSFATLGDKYSINDIVADMVICEIEQIEKMEAEMKIYKEITDIILEAVDSLKSDEKQIIYLYYLIDVKLSWSEIARIVNKSEDNCRGYIREKAMLNIYKALYGDTKMLNNIAK